MKRTAVAFTLTLALSLPAAGAPRDDDRPGRGLPILKKIVRVIKLLVQPLDDSPLLLPPRP